MHSRVVRIKKLGLVTIRPLGHGDTATVTALFDRLGSRTEARRPEGKGPGPSHTELTRLATVDGRRHTLVAYVEGDPHPAAIAQLARGDDCGAHAEIAVAVADRYRGRRVGSTLVELLAADARAAGVTHLVDTRPRVAPSRLRVSARGRSSRGVGSARDAEEWLPRLRLARARAQTAKPR